MALPAQAMERLMQDPAHTPGWSGRLLMFASTLFFLCLLAYYGLLYGYKPYLQREADELSARSKALSQQVQSGSQVKIVEFYSQLANLRAMLDKHVYASNILELLEKSVHPNVYLTKLAFNASNNQISLAGVAKTAADVTAQMQIFQDTPEIAQTVFGNVSVTPAGQWQFDGTLTVSADLIFSSGSAVAPSNASTSPNPPAPAGAASTSTKP